MAPDRLDDGLGERILILAPLGRDTDLTVSVLQRAGWSAQGCADMADLVSGIQKGAGLALVTSESLVGAAIGDLSRTLGRQPTWSDLPVLVFTPHGWGETTTGARVLGSLRPLGNVSLLERPIRVETLLSAVEAGLRARRRQYEIRDLVAQLHEGMHQRDQFLAMLGHELRNPLNAMLTAIQNLGWTEPRSAASASPSSSQEDIVIRQARILARLVDDLLEVSRVTSGKVTLQKSVMDLALLAQSALEAFASQASQQGLEITVAVPSPPPIWVEGDETRLGQVVANLMANAMKYTPTGGRVELAVWQEGKEAVLAVRDDGLGIDSEMLPRIFDLFRQADHTLERAGGGLGIGLTLVRTVVELHGGTVEGRSPGLGKGSEFLVRLPSVAAPAQAPASPPPAPPALQAPRYVFVLEDHADNREGLVLFLRQLGHRVDGEEDGVVGAGRIIETRPDVALIDIGLPGLDGYEVARRVRAVLGSGIYLVALTGYGQSEDRHRALQAGFDTHMAKPIDFADLRRLLAGDGRLASTG